MGHVTILPETTKFPITLMGERAGYCWNAPLHDSEKNYKRGLDCLTSNHGRVLEFVNVEMVLDGYSARVIREWYTHIGGAPTRLQASTRYINYSNFEYITPNSILGSSNAHVIYDGLMKRISEVASKLEEIGIPREDVANVLPLGMATKMVDKRNLRNLIDMSRNRMCARAYWEFRMLFYNVCSELRKVSKEWEYIIDNYMMAKCDALGYCTESKSCGRVPKKESQIATN